MIANPTVRPASHRAIGVFDSGVGGLTVLKALRRRLPKESTIYLGDTARVPYGTKSAEAVRRYSLSNANWLFQNDIKLLVVACNTASAVALPQLQERLPIPVIGVIEPGAKAAAKASKSGQIGVIGTPSTIESGAYQRAIGQLRPGSTVIARSCPLFVPLAEEGWTTGEVPLAVARHYLSSLAQSSLDTLVLGCTHYPLLRAVIAEALQNRLLLVDSAEATAEEVAALLRSRELLGGEAPVKHRYWVTDTPRLFTRVGSNFLGETIVSAEQVDVLLEG